MAKKKKMSKSRVHHPVGPNPKVLAFISLIVLVIVGGFFYHHYTTPPDDQIAARINGEILTKDEVKKQFSYLPPQMQEAMTEASFLPLMVDQIILRQAAEAAGHTTNHDEIYSFVRQSIIVSGLTEEEFFERLQSNGGPPKEELLKHYETQIIINKLLNETVLSKIDVDDALIESYYNENQERFTNANDTLVPLESVRELIDRELRAQQQQEHYSAYIASVRDAAQVTFYASSDPLNSFTQTQDPLCPSDDVPIVFMFGTSTCEHCETIEAAFKRSIQDAVALNKIDAHYYHLDTKDDVLTEEVETEIPAGHSGLFDYYSPNKQVPLLVFGCRYTRLGTTGTGDQVAEEAEFRNILNKILEEYARK